jgi:fused signal recognition particle receptor
VAIQTLFGSLNQPEEPEQSGLFRRMKQAMARTRDGLGDRVEDLLALSRPIDEASLETLEESLIAADLGVPTVTRILDDLRQKLRRTELQDGEALREALQQEIETILAGVTRPARAPRQPPFILFLVGVNGTGKTTTAGKLSAYLQRGGKKVLLCAADTFRAAAIEQLETWSQRSGVELIKSRPGADPSAVLFDALQAAKARNADYVIVDTAGRLHTKAGLMAELEKMHRTAQRFSPEAPHETLLVLDAVTGQNGLQQARLFTESAGVTGIVLTKLDGTAKGGIVVAIAQDLKLPVKFVGVGEQLDDLLPFDAKAFTASLLSR